MHKISNKKHHINKSDYEDFLESEKVQLARVLTLLSLFLYGAFVVVDFFALPSAFYSSLIIRSVVVGVLLLCFLSSYTRFFNKFYSIIIATEFIATIGGVEVMMFISSPSDYAYNTYFAGIMIILIGLYAWTYLSVMLTSVLSILSLCGYFYVELFARDLALVNNYPGLVTTTFMLVSAIIFGLVAQILRNNYLQQNFLLQQSLAKALEAKTEEAEDYEYKANHDHLTGLPNRRYATTLLEGSLEVAKNNDRVLVIMFVDLNGFKNINDIYGHAAGDEVLTIVAKRLELAVRKSDCLARIGGDEYLIGLLLDKENIVEVERMAEKFATIISEPMNVESTMFEVGASVGIAAYPYHGEHIEVLMEIADKKMYQIKENIKNSTDSTIVFFEKNKAN